MSITPLASVDDARLIPFTGILGDHSELFVYQEGERVPFHIRRVFIVRSTAPQKRGEHAHRRCAQLLVALSGSCIVKLDDGVRSSKFRLKNPAEGLHIPPSLWAAQQYAKDTIVMVLCNELYDEADYIRDYATFRQFRGMSA